MKSCLQTDSFDPHKRQYHGSLDAVRKLYARGGIRAFFRGLEPTLIRAPFANAATFVAFEWASNHLRKF